MNTNLTTIESKDFITEFYKVFDLYFIHGSKNQKKSNYFHNYIKVNIEKYIHTNKLLNYEVKLEQKIKSVNASGNKKCDIVVYKNKQPYLIVPVKLAMTSYLKNKNNYWEEMTGDLVHIKWANPDINIIPINIVLNKCPDISHNKIKNIQNINFEHIKIYNILEEKGLVNKFITYILDVEHKCKKGDKYDKCPIIIGFNTKTPHIPISNILNKLIT